MKVAILGYGKMGKEIEKIILKRKHKILIKTNSKSKIDINELKKCDLAFEFTNPDNAFSNIQLCLKNKVSVVSGTTGWEIRKKTIQNLCEKNKVSFLHGSNFSTGINLIKNIIPEINLFMKENHDFSISIKEKHHKYKIDSPSGTAIDLKNILKNKNIEIESERNSTKEIGFHEITIKSKEETIIIQHQANKRYLFALGAVKYGEKIKHKTGYFNLDLKKMF